MKAKKLFFVLCMLIMHAAAHAQITITTPYPVAAEPLTRGLDTSVLTVNLQFTAACANTTVTVLFPSSVTYIPGSVSAISPTTSGFVIAQNNISNLSAPVFSVNVPGPGSLRFTVKRIATCGSLSSGKDSILVSGACGSAVENAANINTYNLLAPSLSLTPSAAISNAITGQTAIRSITVTNGGNGCTDTLRLYVVYPDGGISNTNANKLTITGTDFSPWRTNGDTLFYKIYGATVFEGDDKFCNGESIIITEPIRILKCSPSTVYRAYWGRTADLPGCQDAAGTSSVIMATGAPNITGTYTRIQLMNSCTPGQFTVTYTNSGTGVAASVYNLVANIGYNGTGNATPPQGNYAQNLGRIDSVKVNSTGVTFTPATSTVSGFAAFGNLNTDPDGAGVGLDDLDGDGQYDDLAPGKSVTVTVYEHMLPVSISCPLASYGFFNSHTLSYNSLCTATSTTNALSINGAYRIQYGGPVYTAPGLVSAGVPFTVQTCINLASMFEPYKPKDSLFCDIILSAGLSAAPTPNIMYNDVPVLPAQYSIIPGGGVGIPDTLRIARKGKTNSFCFSADLVYSCGSGGVVTPVMQTYWKPDNCPFTWEKYGCSGPVIDAHCPAPCPAGVVNYVPLTQRLNLGWTDAAMSTKVSPAVVTGKAVYTVLPLDTFQVIVPGKQVGTFNNLYYLFKIGKAAAQDVVTFIGGTLYQKTGAAISSSVIPLPSAAGSTGTVQQLAWNLSSLLNGGNSNNNDSLWLDLRFAVTRANADALYGTTLIQAPNTYSLLYNFNPVNDSMHCDFGAINLMVSGTSPIGAYFGTTTIQNCSPVSAGGSFYVGTNNGYDLFPNEFRPFTIVDSLKLSLPSGFVMFPTTNSYSATRWTSLTSYGSAGVSNAGVVTQNGNVFTIKDPGSAQWILSDMPTRSAGAYGFSYFLSATCQAPNGLTPYSYTLYYKDFAYTGNNSSYVSRTYTNTHSLNYNSINKPSIAVQNNSGTLQGINAQQYWDVKISNPSTQTAPNVWISVEKGTGSGMFTIDSVVTVGSNRMLTGEGSFGCTGRTGINWYKLSTAGIATGVDSVVRIYFHFKNCSPDSLLLKAGWNCTGYSTTPCEYQCTGDSVYLKINPQPSQVQLAMIRQPGGSGSVLMCTTDSTTFVINSAQAANLENPKIQIFPPAGITVSTPFPVEYPLNSGSWYSVNPSAIAGGYELDLSGMLPYNGIPGTVSHPDSYGRQAKVKVTYTTSCDVVSGTSFNFFGYGNNPCGQSAVGNGTSLQSGGVLITGAISTGALGLAVNIPGSTLSCGQTTTVNLTTIAVGMPTQNGDTAIFTLPAGVSYVAGSFTAGYNCTSCTLNSSTDGAGNTILKVKLHPGVTVDDSLKYAIQVVADGTGACGNSRISGAVKRQISGVSCGAAVCSNGSSVIVGTASSNLLTINKPFLSITSGAVTSGNWLPGSAQTVNMVITNAGAAAAANTYKIEFYCGSSSMPFSTNVITKNIATNTSVTESFTLSIPAVPICGFGALISARINPVLSSGIKQCLCVPSEYFFLSILPANLQTFTASENDCKVTLMWKVAEEQSLAMYTVEYSTNGLTFVPLSNIVPTGSNSSYTCEHRSAEGRIYYRLKMTTINGAFKYSAVIAMNVSCNNKSVQVYPNPASTDVNINLSGYKGKIVYAFYNHTGQLVQSGTLINGPNKIDVQELRSGTYSVVIVDNGNEKQVYKLNIVHL